MAIEQRTRLWIVSVGALSLATFVVATIFTLATIAASHRAQLMALNTQVIALQQNIGVLQEANRKLSIVQNRLVADHNALANRVRNPPVVFLPVSRRSP